MDQAERIAKLSDYDADIRKLEVALDEAKAKLRAAKDIRSQLLLDCTHKKADGSSAWDETGPFPGGVCSICGITDF